MWPVRPQEQDLSVNVIAARMLGNRRVGDYRTRTGEVSAQGVGGLVVVVGLRRVVGVVRLVSN